MSEPTTTPQDPTPAGAGPEPAQPAAVASPGAATEPQAQPTTSTEGQDPQAGEPDNLAWLQKKGIDPGSPEALAKTAEMYRNAEKLMHQSTAKASELEKTLVGDPAPLVTEELDIPRELLEHPVIGKLVEKINTLEAGQSSIGMQQRVSSFFVENPEAKAYETTMEDIVKGDATIKSLVKGGYLSLDKLYAMAKGSDPTREAQLKTEGGKEALQKVADKQQAKAIHGAATSSQLDPAASDAFLEGFTKPW